MRRVARAYVHGLRLEHMYTALHDTRGRACFWAHVDARAQVGSVVFANTHGRTLHTSSHCTCTLDHMAHAHLITWHIHSSLHGTYARADLNLGYVGQCVADKRLEHLSPAHNLPLDHPIRSSQLVCRKMPHLHRRPFPAAHCTHDPPWGVHPIGPGTPSVHTIHWLCARSAGCAHDPP